MAGAHSPSIAKGKLGAQVTVASSMAGGAGLRNRGLDRTSGEQSARKCCINSKDVACPQQRLDTGKIAMTGSQSRRLRKGISLESSPFLAVPRLSLIHI